jgi:hypothetical protein
MREIEAAAAGIVEIGHLLVGRREPSDPVLAATMLTRAFCPECKQGIKPAMMERTKCTLRVGAVSSGSAGQLPRT